ncbi:hypothetical protein F53441_10445 [Fusarium austroafricanum]|uniref:Zn(2)-C6 fungal-type domain-containing protein n=1 Tax=Fusarium austroafricanum TaxID=2364996 RepID=A0A8H4NS83_9HYPO|nr:hypothetical protein F53441_10445 [Fusarium austroafricanum]
MAATLRRTQRTSAACDFCRRRKLGCDNAKPKCENCQGRAVECTYTKKTAQARPSNARIHELEEENARLRQHLRSQSVVSRKGQHSDGTLQPESEAIILQESENYGVVTHENNQTQSPQTNSTSVTYAPATTGQPEDNTFHGPASGTVDSETFGNSFHHSNSPDDSLIKNHLLAETARQRQLEGINLRAGKLKFGDIDHQVGTDLFSKFWNRQNSLFGVDLLSNFWNRQHYIGSVVYRTAFMRDMACNGPYYSELLLNAILFAGSKHTAGAYSPQTLEELNAIGRPFRARFEEILHSSGSQILFKSEITTIQALLVVADALFSWCNERSLSWHYMGIAISMIVDLGLHVDGPSRRSSKNRSAEDVEIERRLFWAAFTLDKVQSIYQGRPSRLRETDNRVPIRFLDEYEELEDFNTRTYSAQPGQLGCPTYSVSTFKHLCKLSIIIDRVLCALYAEDSSLKPADQSWETANRLHRQLKGWRDNFPAHLEVNLIDSTTSTILPHNLSLLALYNSLIVLVYRPFLSEGHLTSLSATAAPEAFSNCATAAFETNQVLQLYKQHFCFKSAPYFLSYATYVSATIHVRMAAQQDRGSKAHACLRACLEILSEQQIRCHGPKRTMKILLGIMERLKVNVGEFAAIAPTSCQTEDSCGINPTQPPVQPGTDHQVQLHASDVDMNMANMGFDFTTDLQLSDFDVEQIMQSFLVEPLPPAQQDFQANIHPGFDNDGIGEGSLPSQGIMTFDSLFGFDSSI